MKTVAIWDADGTPPASDWTTILWRTFAPAERADLVSMPRMVEERATELRARYLAWIHDLGQATVRGKRVVEHMAVRPGFSYWWMTTLSHTPNYYESPHITDAIKCLALEAVIAQEGDSAAIRLHTTNAALRQVLERFCRARNLSFSVGPVPAQQAARAAAGSRRERLGAIAAAVWRQLRRAGSVHRSRPATAASVCFFDLLVYLKPGAIADGRFESEYWGGLTRLLDRAKRPSTWVHIFYPHAAIATPDDAERVLRRFATGSAGLEAHYLLDGQMTAHALVATLRSYGRLVRAAWRLRGVGALFQPSGSSFNFWPFFSRNWRSALLGAPAVRHTLRLALYEQVLTRLPRQPLGFFLLENQPWELALLEAWRSAGHGRIVGVPHTTVRFWDLRYFYDPRSYERTGSWDLPIPDTVAVNGPAALAAYRGGGYPAERLVEVEALRFAHLADAVRLPSAERIERVLICGDNIPGSNDKVMAVVERAAALLPPETRFVFKPHKAAPFDASHYPRARVELREGDLPAMLAECDLAITGTVTSASADAYSRGRRVAVLLDGGALDGCPLRGLEGVQRFSSAEELVRIIESSAPPPLPVALFHLDPALTRWRHVLGLDPAA